LLGAKSFLVEVVPLHVGKDQLFGEVLHRDDGGPGGHHPLSAVSLRRAVERGLDLLARRDRDAARIG
jgi:hypothetical protein